MLAYSFLDLEAGHSGRNGVCDTTNADESQGSLVDFIYDENSSGDDQENEVDMANMRSIYATSLLPLSQQPQGFGFCAPKYNNRGFKLRKTEVLSGSPSASPELIVPPLPVVEITDFPTAIFPNSSVSALLKPTVTFALPKLNRMRLIRKNPGAIALREPPPLEAVSTTGASKKFAIYTYNYTFTGHCYYFSCLMFCLVFPFCAYLFFTNWPQSLCTLSNAFARLWK
jgi:hypothetical protein